MPLFVSDKSLYTLWSVGDNKFLIRLSRKIKDVNSEESNISPNPPFFSLSTGPAQKKHGMPHQHYVIPQSELTASLIPMSLWVSEYVDFIYKCSAKFSTSSSQQLAHLSVCRLYSEYFSWNQLAATAENVADETNCLCVRLRTLLCLQACVKYFLKCIWHKSYSEKKSIISMLKMYARSLKILLYINEIFFILQVFQQYALEASTFHITLVFAER